MTIFLGVLETDFDFCGILIAAIGFLAGIVANFTEFCLAFIGIFGIGFLTFRFEAGFLP
jgi:hypothetical protein